MLIWYSVIPLDLYITPCQASNEELWGAGIHMKTGQGEGSGIGRGFKARTVDRCRPLNYPATVRIQTFTCRTPLLVKYFFGEGYAHGSQTEGPGKNVKTLSRARKSSLGYNKILL